MSGLRNIAGSEGASSIPIADSYIRAAHEIHILLVDHEPEALFDTVKMLKLCGYRVTRVDRASIAMEILSSNKTRFDLVMANSNSPDNQGHKLLEQAVTKNKPIILMSFDDNVVSSMRAMESGALLYLKKPIPMEMLKNLWQLVMSWGRMRNTVRDRPRELFSTPMISNKYNNKNTNGRDLELTKMVVDGATNVNGNGLGLGGTYVENGVELGAFGGRCNVDKGHEFNVVATANNGLQFGAVGGNYSARNGARNVNNKGHATAASNNKGKEILQLSSNDDSSYEDYCAVNNNRWEGYPKRKRNAIEWTEELHARFVYATQKLGPGRCFPKEITELMNVPGLTRMQVASYLQRCRNQNSRLPEARKSQSEIQPDSSSSQSPLRSSTRTVVRFGSMPKLSKTTSQSNRPEKPDQAGLLQNVTTDGRPSGPVNLDVANGGGGHNYGAPMVPCQIITEKNTMKNSAPEGAGTHHQIPSNPNYPEPDDDFFDFTSAEALLQNTSNSAQHANQNVNNPENRCCGSDPNVGGPSLG